MNKLWKLWVCMILIVGLLAGCGTTRDSSNAHLVTPSGVAISIGDDGDEIETLLGVPDEFSEAQSCYGNGFDRVYTYVGFEITTYPSQNEGNFVSVIALLGNNVETGSGLKVGQAFTKAVEIYGESYMERGTSRVYTLDENITLWVDIEEDIITRIEFRAP